MDYNTHEIRNFVNRIADFDTVNDSFIPAKYSDWYKKDIENYNPHKIRAFANTLTPYIPEIRSWHTISGINSHTGEPFINTESNFTGQHPIEILFLSDIDLDKHNSDSEIRSILQKGIEIPPYTTDEFLIVTNKSNNVFESLLCNKKTFQNISNSNTFRVEKHCTDMFRTIHHIKLYTFNEFDMLDTSVCSIFDAEGQQMPIRYFHKHLTLGREERKFFLRNPEDYAKSYISKYIKNNKEILKITKSEAQKWVTMIEEAFSNSCEIDSFFDQTGFKTSDVEYALRHVSNEVKEFYLQDDDFFKIISANLSEDPDLVKLCKEEIKKQWLVEQDDFKKEILSQIDTLQDDLSELEENKSHIEQTIDECIIKRDELMAICEKLQGQNEELEKKSDNITIKTAQQLKRFQNDIVELATLSGFCNTSTVETAQPYIVQTAINSPMCKSEIEDIDCFIDDLQDNLITYGLKNEYSYDYALFITAAMVIQKNIVVCGSKSNEIGNAVSLLMQNGKSPVEIQLPLGWNNIGKIIEIINNSDNEVFIIHGALDTINTSILSSVSKYCIGKTVFFSCEDPDTFNIIPRQLGNYVAFISTDSAWGIASEDDLRFGEFKIHNVNIQTNKAQFEFIKDVEEVENIKTLYQNNATIVTSAYQQIAEGTDVLTFSNIFNFLMCCCLNKSDVINVLSKCHVKDSTIALLEGELCHE